LARRYGQPPIRLTQGIDSRIDLAALAFEVADLRRDLLRQQTHLEFRLAGILSPASKDVMNLGQREPELLAFKNHLEMKPVAGIVAATGPFPSRVQQAAVLIKPEGPDAHLEIARHFPDCR
jgi:predicted component of type VI protein secretion system